MNPLTAAPAPCTVRSRLLRAPSIALACSVLLTAFSPGCTALYAIFGPGGLFPPDGSGGGGSTNPGTGGLQTPTNTIPTTTQPAAVASPTYRVSLLDDLLEQTAGAAAIIATDLDNDTVADFASISSESQVVLLHIRAVGTGRFDQISIAGGLPLTRMIRIASADFDGDGRQDLAVAVNHTGLAATPPATKVGQIVLIFAPLDPRDQLSWLTVPLPNSLRQNDDISITDMAVADFDGVNGPDIAFMSNEPPPIGTTLNRRYIFLFLNPGGANARNGANWGGLRPSPLGNVPPFIEVDAPDGGQIGAADLDSDGDLDLVAAYPPSESFNIRWLENPGPGNVDPNPANALPRWVRHFVGQQDSGANVIALGDIDGDGNVDVAAGSNSNPAGLVSWFQNPGPAAIAIQDYPWLVYNVGIIKQSPFDQLRLADLNNDGRLDVWIGAGGVISGFFPRPGSLLFDYWTPFSVVSTNPVATFGVPAFLDIDSNGTTDFVVPLNRPGLSQDQFAIFARQ